MPTDRDGREAPGPDLPGARAGDQPGAALALLTLLGGLASPLFIPLVGVAIPHLGWRSTLVILAGVQLCVAFPLHALLLRRHPEDLGLYPDGAPSSGAVDAPSSSGISVREALHGAAFWMLSASSALTMLGSMVIVAHQVAYLIGRGVDPVLAAGVAGMVGLVSLPGRYVLNALSDRMAARTLLALSLVMQAVGVLVLMQAATLPIMIIYVILYGVAFGAISPLRAAVMADYFGRRSYGAIIAAQGVPVALCAGFGPFAAGWLFDLQHSYTLALSLAAGAFLLAAMGIVLTPRGNLDGRGDLLANGDASELGDARAKALGYVCDSGHICLCRDFRAEHTDRSDTASRRNWQARRAASCDGSLVRLLLPGLMGVSTLNSEPMEVTHGISNQIGRSECPGPYRVQPVDAV